MRTSKTLRIVTLVLLSLAAAMTLLGGVGSTCVAFNAEAFGAAFAPMIPVKPVLQALVVVSIVAGIVGVVGIVRLARRAPRAVWWLVGFLAVGLAASGIQFWYSLTLRGSTAPNNVRLYLTALALAWLLVLGLPGMWRRAGFDRTRPDPGGTGTAAGLAMIAAGLLTATTPWWAASTHVVDGVNTAEVLQLPLLAAGALLAAAGSVALWGGRLVARRWRAGLAAGRA